MSSRAKPRGLALENRLKRRDSSASLRCARNDKRGRSRHFSAITAKSGSTETTACGQGFTDITINQNDSLSLDPGNYGNILVKKNGVLFFTATGDGIYNICSLDAGINTKLLFGDVADVRMEDKLDTDQNSFIGPSAEATIEASDIVIYVAGINGNNGNLGATPKAAQVGLSNTVEANIYAKNGTLWLRQGTVATGAFLGKDVIVGINVQVALDSFLGSGGGAMPRMQASGDMKPKVVFPLEVPQAFSLEQNYPNPFKMLFLK